ncbi:sortilin-like [Arapaima gigas]
MKVLLVFLPLVMGSDFPDRPSRAHLTFGTGSRSGFGLHITRRSVSTEHREVRSAGDGGNRDACTALREYEKHLENNTHTNIFNDLSGSVSLAWVGDGTGVVLVMTSYQVPIFMLEFGQSKLYRSENYGKSFQDVTDLINSTVIRPELGIAIDPQNSGKVILTGDVSGTRRSQIFCSMDFGNTFTGHTLPFELLLQIMYSPQDSQVLLAISTEVSNNIRMIINTYVCHFRGLNNTIFFTTNANGSCSDKGTLELKKTTNYGQTFKTIATKIYSFGVGGRFLFASVMTGTDNMRVIHVSVDQGEGWNIAQLPDVGHEQFYSILAANDDMVFMHVDEPGDTGVGTIYVSDDRGTIYSKSLERHLYTSKGGDTDFTNVTSLRGVYLTSVLDQNDLVQTVVTFDQGGEWMPLQKPVNIQCKATSGSDQCSFHIHASYSMTMKINVPMLPLTEPNAVGLILAHGSIGEDTSVMMPDVYVSDDGGYSWIKALSGPHHYAILDSGGLLVAVEDTSHPINQIKFSTDEGQCWYLYNFTSVPLYFSGLASEPGAHSMNVSLWGYRESLFFPYWVSVTIDFKQLLSRDCDTEDYVEWLAHSDDISDPSDGCMLGYKEKFLRLRKDSVCWNGRDYVVNKQPTPCPCTLDDFLCDFGYYRVENSSECVEQQDLVGHILEFCLHGKLEQLQTSGYRKVPGDKCEGGNVPERKEIDLSSKCVSNLLSPKLETATQSSSAVPITAIVIVILVMSVVAGIFFIKKYVCGGRFLVHRFSVLQEQDEANGIDELETCVAESNRRQFHDDSDEDLLD